MSDLVDIFGPGLGYIALGATAFDGKKLNQLLDLVEAANPADLEHAGEALEKATVAINDAAKDLNDFVKSTEWEGEGAAAFQAYGTGVVGYAWDIAKVANAVGAQMKVASTGLASVRNAMPPRDTRAVADQKEPRQFKPEERRPDNPDYQKALQVEKDRQEAINQMNRLGSYYVVSTSTLAGQEMPPPPAAYKAAVPKPTGRDADLPTGESSTAGVGWSRTSEISPGSDRAAVGAYGGSSRAEALGAPAGVIGSSPSMQIDSVVAPPSPAPATGPATPPAQIGPTGPVTGNPPPVMTNLGTPPRTKTPSATGTKGLPRPGVGPTTASMGRSGASGGGSTQAGRSSGAVGRPGSTAGSATSAGRSGTASGRPGATGTGPAVGRPGVVGGTGSNPVAGRPGMPGQAAGGRQSPSHTPRVGHSNGIVGGTPQRATGGTTGSRVPKGTVIGAEGATTGRTQAARPSQSGVIGAPRGGSTARAAGGGIPGVNGVVGTSRGAVAGSGGAARAGERPGQRQSRDEEQERTGVTRPDYLTEDEETWAVRRRPAVPPVID
jgi:hypothetical protein